MAGRYWLAGAAAVATGWALGGTALAAPAPDDAARRCAALVGAAGSGIDAATIRAAAPPPAARPMGAAFPPGTILPRHCDAYGTLDRRTGIDGQAYAIHYHLRLPEHWNGRFLFQGGGGTNGVVGDALGPVGTGQTPALARGYAVVSQDSGHDNGSNNDPARGGVTAFGADPRARADYGGTSLKRVADVAKATVRRFYGSSPTRSYFFGCSKGGQEGMVFAQRYPATFDGIVAAAPGFALPRAALAQTWDVQTFGALAGANKDRGFDVSRLSATFSDAQLALVRQAVLAACDADDGLADGIVGRFDRCTTVRVRPHLTDVTCRRDDTATCLSPAQVAALIRSIEGPRGAAGRALYASWPWDGGIGAPGWRLWKIGSPQLPALNVLTGGPALAMIFTVPPTPLHDDPQSFVDYETGFDVARDPARIDATDTTFLRSGWQDLAARSDDLDVFRRHGGKLLVPHGASDPVFSIADTIAWYERVEARYGAAARGFARVFAVPGMNHCGGGPATDRYDALAALVDWVEHKRAPERILAKAGPATPWPGRTRPLCAYPAVAVHNGRGDIDHAANFICKR